MDLHVFEGQIDLFETSCKEFELFSEIFINLPIR